MEATPEWSTPSCFRSWLCRVALSFHHRLAKTGVAIREMPKRTILTLGVSSGLSLELAALPQIFGGLMAFSLFADSSHFLHILVTIISSLNFFSSSDFHIFFFLSYKPFSWAIWTLQPHLHFSKPVQPPINPVRSSMAWSVTTVSTTPIQMFGVLPAYEGAGGMGKVTGAQIR